MIYTITFNPAIDYIVYIKDLKPGSVNRADTEEIYFGGKGINVSIILKELGIDSKALGFVAGFTGDAIEQGILEMGVKTDFVHLPVGCSRINVKLKSGPETDVNGQGPEIDSTSMETLFYKLDKLSQGDTLILAGSIPNSLPKDIYENIMFRLSNKKLRFVVDATNELLMNVLKYRPFLIKPNIYELGELFGVEIHSREEIVSYANELQKKGARNILVSMGDKGAVLVDEEKNVHSIDACTGTPVNTVGAVDSMLAGFLAGLMERENDIEYALKLATAAGGATAFSKGLAGRDEIFKLMKQLDDRVIV